MADREFEWQVVGMTMPLSGAQGIDDREGGSAPAKPGAFRDQLKRHGPLADARGGQNPLTGVLAVVQAGPERIRHHLPSWVLKEGRHAWEHGEHNWQERQSKQRHQPGPTGRAQHHWNSQHKRTPAVAGFGEYQTHHQGDGQNKHNKTLSLLQTWLNQSRQGQRPDHRQPG